MKIIHKETIQKLVDIPSILECVEEGFILFSRKEAIIGPVGALHFTDPPGDCHIKYGYKKFGSYYVVKVASSFYENQALGIPTGNGMMLLFDKNNGMPVAILLDDGLLTDLRTAAAGCIAAKYLAPKKVSCIGIVGTGAQAYFQLKFLPFATDCKKVLVWGRDRAKAQKFCENRELNSFQMKVASDLDELTSNCNLIVTTTSSTIPLLFSRQIKKGIHITAMGADDVNKQELDSSIFGKADRIIVDSREQCIAFGDTSYALKEGLIKENQIIEMGEMILNPQYGRVSEDQITIADLTGIAIQDLQIAENIIFSKKII